MIESFLLGTGHIGRDPAARAWLRAGACLDLHADGRSQVEVRSPDGRPLGWLPSEDAKATTALIDTGAVPTARVRGVIPAFGRPRVQLSIGVRAEDGRLQ